MLCNNNQASWTEVRGSNQSSSTAGSLSITVKPQERGGNLPMRSKKKKKLIRADAECAYFLKVHSCHLLTPFCTGQYLQIPAKEMVYANTNRKTKIARKLLQL